MAFTVVVTIGEKSLYRFIIDENEKISLGTGKKDSVYVAELDNSQLVFSVSYDTLRVSGKKISDCSSCEIPSNGEGVVISKSLSCVVYCADYTNRFDKKFELPYRGIVKIGRNKDNHVILSNIQISRRHVTLNCEDGVVHVVDGYEGHPSSFGVYLNGKRIHKAILKSGDVIDLAFMRILLQNSELHIQNSLEPVPVNEIKQASFHSAIVEEDEEEGRKYRRSPRTREMLPYEKIVLDKPPSKMHKAEKRRGLFMNLFSSGVMLGTSVLAGGMSPALLAARSASLITPAANVSMAKSQSKKDLKKYQEYEAERQKKYGAYIESQRALIGQVAKKQKEILESENPSPEVCVQTVKDMKRTLWERRPGDSDFLHVRLGMGYEKLCVPVEGPKDAAGFQLESEEINELAKQIIEETRIVDNVPSRVDFINYKTVGIIGERSKVIPQIWNMLIALTTAHFYEDVKIVGFFDEEEKQFWNAIRWLPHVWDENRQTRFLVYSNEKQENIERIMEIFHEIISKRSEAEAKPNGKECHYVFVIGSRKLLDNTSLLKDLVAQEGYGINTIFAYNLPGKDSGQQYTYLPEECRFVIDMDDPYGCCAYDVRKVNERFIFTPDEFYSTNKIDQFCRLMASIEYQSSIAKMELPSGISFFQGMNITKVQQLDAWGHWSNNIADKSMAVPMAVLQNGKQFHLDILRHGPHGLVAGTTGSGKSEFIISWLLSVAINYHPYDVSFVVIDYKGGGLANDLEGIPHMVGKITNIGQNIQRSMNSLKGEVLRRQKIFDETGIKDIKDYIHGYHLGKYKEPLPRLLLIVDEFAELKSQEPEFLKELVSVARIGRTLGINLVLATQNPSGVVDDQIRSNSNLQICLKVQKPEQSRDVIGHTEASQITQPGRAYVKVGADEIFELVQSYWSGAPYLGENAKNSEAGNQVRIVETTGERIKTVSEEKTRFKSDVTELQMVSKYLAAVAREHELEKMPCPWLPELPKELYLNDLDVKARGFNGKDWEGELPWFKVPIGLYDQPYIQKQGVQMLDFDSEGHYGIYGAPGSGKTTLLMTILASIGKWYSPADAKIYILDFGSNVMKIFDKMPHVAGVALSYEEDRVNKIAEVIEKALEERKSEFAEYGISSLSAYRKYVSKKYPAIILAIDNLIPIFEAYPNYEKFLYRIVSEASSYGIYLVYTANSQNGIKFKLIQNMKSAIAFELADSSDYSIITGRPESLATLKIKGRGLFKSTNGPVEFQAALYGQGDGAVEMGNHLKATFEEMCRCWKQPKEVLIKEVPNRISMDVLKDCYDEKDMIPVGYGVLSAEPVVLNMRRSHRAMIAGKSGAGKSKLLSSIAKLLYSKEEENLIYIIDSKKRALQPLRSTSKNYATADDVQGVQVLLREVLQEMINRQTAYQQAEKTDASFDGVEFLKPYPQICVLIDDMTDFLEYAEDDNYAKLNAIAAQKNALGTIVIGAVRQQDLKENQYDTLLNKMISGQNALVLSGFAQLYDCFTHDFGYEEKIKELSEGLGLFYQQGHCEKIKLPE